LIDSDTEVVSGIWAVRTGGHTCGHQIVTISSGDSTAVYCGDLIPTTGHLRSPYIAGSDLFPLETLEHKKKLVDRIIENGWIVAFDHDLEYKFATLARDGNRIEPTKVGEPFLAALRTCKENLDESQRTMG
jgi:glyoxylase-like metal-dependent hydrolase (beta-lactamase superfamily II)